MPGEPSSKVNARIQAIPNEGRCLITTLVSGWYQWYAPLFVYCVRRAFPDDRYDCLVYVRGKLELPTYLSECVRELTPIWGLPIEPFITAAQRFTIEPEEWTRPDYTFITDVDILMRAEEPDLIDQHMLYLRRFELECYENYVSGYYAGQPRLPGVHFVTKDWWNRTAAARDAENRLLHEPIEHYCHDEVALARIVKNSGLPLQDKRLHLWSMHGLHLGDWRRRLNFKERNHPTLNAHDKTLVQELCADKAFMWLLEQCAPHCEQLQETWNLLCNH